MRIITITSKEDYVDFFIDIFQLLNLPSHMRVEGRMKEFLTHCVIMFNEGWKLNSKEAVEEIADRMNFSNRDEVYNYRTRLKKGGLIVQTEDDLILPPSLRLKKIPKRITFKFQLENGFIDADRKS